MVLRFFRPGILAAVLVAGVALVRAQGNDDLTRRTWTVAGVAREALVAVPKGAEKGGAPVVFVFHGHTGTMQHAARTFALHRLWPEAIVVYPQGLPTPSPLVDAAGAQAGWQAAAGAQGDRDLAFFDAMLADLRRQYRIDDKRVFATGHSNGGAFTYLLWAERGDALAAVAPSAAVLGRGAGQLRPKPALHIGSPQDPLVKFAWQERMIDHVLVVDGCGPRKPDASGYTAYPSKSGNDVATYIHSEGHRFPAAAPELIVKFFQAHPRR